MTALNQDNYDRSGKRLQAKKHDFAVVWNRRIKVMIFQRIHASNTVMRSGELCIRIFG